MRKTLVGLLLRLPSPLTDLLAALLIGFDRVTVFCWTKYLAIGDAARNSIDNVLIVRVDKIGDFVLWISSAKALRKHLHGKRVCLVGNVDWIEWARALDLADHYIAVDRKRFRVNPLYRSRIMAEIGLKRFSMAIHPTYSREILLGDSLIRFSGADVCIGSSGDITNTAPWLKALSDRWYTKLIAATPDARMELIRNAEFLRNLGIRNIVADRAKLGGPVVIAAQSPDYFVIFPGASQPGRMWAPENFIALAKRIHASTGWQCKVCGGPAEYDIGDSIARGLEPPAENLCGSTTVMELAAVIKHAKLVVSNETSAIHIAAAMNIPSVCVVGGGHFGRFLPYQLELYRVDDKLPRVVAHKMECFGCNWKCIYSISSDAAFPCIANVRLDDVWAEVETLLAQRVR